MAGVSLGSSRSYPSLPQVTGDIKSHTSALLVMKEAVEIHERKTGEKMASFVRLGELVDLRILKVQDGFIYPGEAIVDPTAGGYLSLVDAAATYLTILTAAATYQPISLMVNYLTTAVAAATYLTVANAATTYLRLDTSNDPLTGSLVTQELIPSGVNTYNLGSESVRYAAINANRGYFLQQITAGSAVSWDNSIVASGAYSFNLLNETGPAYTGGTQTVRLNTNVAADGIQLNVVNLGGISTNAKGNNSLLIDLAGGGAINCISALPSTAAGGTSTASNGLAASLFIGVLGADNSGLNNTISASGSFAGGCIVGGYCTNALGSGAVNSRIACTLPFFLNGGSVAFGFTNRAEIITSAEGGWASGYSANGGLLTATATGAFSVGAVNGAGAILRSSGQGAFSQGAAIGAGAIVEATAQGAFVQGGAIGAAAIIRASGLGSFAQGYATAGQGITATANNAAQFGMGQNTEADTLSVGQAMRLKGTAGAPGAGIRNGDMWVSANAVFARSEGLNVKLSDATNVWTTGAHATLRNFTGTTTAAEALQLLETLIEDLKNRGILS